ncbi:hypothetical protein B1no1_20330 [Thermolongibacillus altinsuensis]|nr:hypothetical protein B1no1_20330 [Thermolongibacillus altinsuensis]
MKNRPHPRIDGCSREVYFFFLSNDSMVTTSIPNAIISEIVSYTVKSSPPFSTR